ncbi:hypothetical protein A4S06_08290 [Erysipelotrichaceae bacterium MTC7]|nr:hypothetical protein A4S06_08290 [Erysipelotrichaceae bacterium MTC7]
MDGKNFKKYREDRNLTISELADVVQISVGELICMEEYGLELNQDSKIYEIADYFAVDEDDFLEDIDYDFDRRLIDTIGVCLKIQADCERMKKRIQHERRVDFVKRHKKVFMYIILIFSLVVLIA